MERILYTPEEVAKDLSLTVEQVKRLARDGGMPHHRVGRYYRFTPSDIDKYVNMTRRDATGQTDRSRAAHKA